MVVADGRKGEETRKYGQKTRTKLDLAVCACVSILSGKALRAINLGGVGKELLTAENAKKSRRER
jgi:hypothetical protein